MNLPFPPPHFGIIGHRGVSQIAPENTLAAFRAARATGLNWIEFDVQLSKDGELVVIHDDLLDRTTDGKGLVQDLTLEALKLLDAGKWFGEQFAGEQIPTLQEVLPLLIEEGLHANIEMKIPDGSDLVYLQKMAKRLSDIIIAMWPTESPPLSVSSFNHQALFYFRQYLPEHPIGFLV